jgi:hypothetical protein
MNIIIDTQKLTNPNDFGELLRNYCFSDKPCMTMTGFHKPYGCYSTFDLKEGFKKLNEQDEIYKKLWVYSGIWDTDEKSRFFAYTNGQVNIGWYWDGDGTLVIQCGNKVARNDDCKCDYNWEWINE